jgi:hypothetical protein
MNRWIATKKSTLTTNAICLLCASWALGSCYAKRADRAKRSEPAPSSGGTTVTSQPKEMLASRSDQAGQQSPRIATAVPMTQRKIVYRGELRLETESYAPARAALEQAVNAVGGYLASSNVNHQIGRISSATLVLRIPAEHFRALIKQIGNLGTVIHESISSDDITDEYYDLDARLNNSRKLETRLLELLKRETTKLSDLLQVEQQIARVRQEIDQVAGKLRRYDKLVAFSTLTVQLQVREKFTPAVAPTLGDDLGGTLDGSFAALKSFGRGVLVALVGILPWLPLIAPGIVIPWYLVRRRRKKRLAAAAAASQ